MNKTAYDTREKILSTAEQLIYQHGIQATSMDLLVKTSGVARKSIYRHFATKDDVAAAALHALAGLVSQRDRNRGQSGIVHPCDV